jgi:hypothetical protein
VDATQFPRKQQFLAASQTLPVYPSVNGSFEQEGKVGTSVESKLQGETKLFVTENLYQFQFVDHQSHMDWPMFDSGPLV